MSVCRDDTCGGGKVGGGKTRVGKGATAVALWAKIRSAPGVAVSRDRKGRDEEAKQRHPSLSLCAHNLIIIN